MRRETENETETEREREQEKERVKGHRQRARETKRQRDKKKDRAKVFTGSFIIKNFTFFLCWPKSFSGSGPIRFVDLTNTFGI